MALIDTEDVEMLTTAQTDPSKGHIKWADEQMDTVIVEDTEQKDTVVEHSVEEAVEIYILKVSRVEEVNIIRNNKLGNVLKVITGQSNGSLRNVPVLECSLVQDEYLLMNLVHEEVDETD